jgi:hypothetical protein
MKMPLFLLSASRLLALAGLLGATALPAVAAPMITLKGSTPEVKLETESELRLSLLGWTDPDRAKVLVEEYRNYLANQDHEALQKVLFAQDTAGYLFTRAATGYTVKYAWQDTDSTDGRTVLVVTPALKTRNPYMWKQANNDPAPFTLLELRWQGEEAVLKTSLDAAIEISADGKLQLQDWDSAATFGRLKDDTPYYLKGRS